MIGVTLPTAVSRTLVLKWKRQTTNRSHLITLRWLGDRANQMTKFLIAEPNRTEVEGWYGLSGPKERMDRFMNGCRERANRSGIRGSAAGGMFSGEAKPINIPLSLIAKVSDRLHDGL
ncbi:hypothetical protein FNV43_RR09559 [Rhamnella rubrinervis]|uniref:Uncharacterized protein n=1 Tax=Rhamnella rubrinervis TaxID=2594499 RepID=A0A8K0HBG2_9ROSA|nr:hypothetical protein FNV43_RR09559 [Rhamnella rubrinervis]